MRIPCLLLALACLPTAPARAWGVAGHRLLAAGALRDLPPEVAAWYRGREAQVVQHAPDPDAWRTHDPLEAPRHFLDSEAYGGAGGVPVCELEAQGRLGAGAFQASGQVPWVIQARTLALAQAFRNGERDRVALETAWLSHYAGDLQVPLHTTANFDGELTGQAGIHARWESGLLERMEAQAPFEPEVRPATPGPGAFGLPFAWLAESFALVPDVLEADRIAKAVAVRGGEGGYGPVYWAVFQDLQGELLRERLARAAHRTALLVLEAWGRAGRPAPPAAVHGNGPLRGHSLHAGADA